MGLRLLVTGLAATSLFLAPRAADACSCIGRFPVAQARHSDAVMEVEPIGTIEDESELGSRIFIVRVVRRWKGDVGDTTTIDTGSGGSSCGTGLSFTDTNVVFARALDDGPAEFSAGSCSAFSGDEAEDIIERLERSYGIGCRVAPGAPGTAPGLAALFLLVGFAGRSRRRCR